MDAELEMKCLELASEALKTEGADYPDLRRQLKEKLQDAIERFLETVPF